ncbi:MAG: glycosyltransferase [Candidatus Accumulibacter sp.]|uniref:glycosyltransferase n=1 Tax=Accumulibacter sp. TaxID=2053492 RepID=UPI0028794310|nr:glycosyltransferase [Accumulibacter sp.]MDS4014319.1 glycosyltransferase [Accumulibacter sp.]
MPTHDPQALAEAFLRCAADVGAAKEMGAAGRRRALRLYDERRVVALQIERIGEHLRFADPAMSRICIVLTSPFAYESFIRPHAERLARDHAVTVCFNRDESSIPVHFSPGVRFVPMPIVRDIAPLRDLRALFSVWRFMRRERFDLVFSITPKGGMVAMLAARLAGVPSRVHCFTGQVWATRRGLARFLLQSVDRVLALAASDLLADSASQRRFLIDENVVPERKVAVVGAGSICGVDIDRFRADLGTRRRIRGKHAIADDEICLLFVGRLTEEKGVADLIEAFRHLVLRHPDLRLMLVGPDEGGLAGHWGDIPGLVFAGYTQAVHEYMAAADVLCLPSYREGFGSVLIEAGACGLPVVASRIYGITDAVVDGETGLLHAPGDVNDLCAQLERLVAAPQLRKMLGLHGRQRAEGEFSRDYVVGLYADYMAARIAPARASRTISSSIGQS